jgi:hypothetical protein
LGVAFRKRWLAPTITFFAVVMVGYVFAKVYVGKHPLVFNESFWEHAHCIPQAGMALRLYAGEHHGEFPTHTNGYGDALLLLWDQMGGYPAPLTGPGYDGESFKRAHDNKRHLPEADCGRVYIQGLSENTDPRVVVLFDKRPTPGGDHTQGFKRLSAPLGREVAFVTGSHRFVRESEWPAFAKEQIELLVEVGITRQEAERLYSQKPRSLFH